MNFIANKKLQRILIGSSIVVAIFLSVSALKPPAPISIPTDLQAVLWPVQRQLTDFSLLEKNQQPFNLARLDGKWTLLFFGYTNCPDVCPMTLTTLNAVYDELQQYPEIHAKTQVVFVSVDSTRDTPELLSTYASHFDKSFIGATGDTEQIENLTRQLSAGYAIREPNKYGDYLVDHTSSIYLIGPKQQVHGAFSSPHNTSTIVTQYLGVLKLRSNS